MAAVKAASVAVNRVVLVVATVAPPLAKALASLTSPKASVVVIAALSASPVLPVVMSVNR